MKRFDVDKGRTASLTPSRTPRTPEDRDLGPPVFGNRRPRLTRDSPSRQERSIFSFPISEDEAEQQGKGKKPKGIGRSKK